MWPRPPELAKAEVREAPETANGMYVCVCHRQTIPVCPHTPSSFHSLDLLTDNPFIHLQGGK